MAAEAAGLGVQPLDLLLAPVPRGATLLLLNDPAIEAEPFLYQAAHAHLRGGDTVVYVATSRSPDAVRKAMREYGFDPALAPGELLFVDAFSALLGSKAGERYAVGNPQDLDEVVAVLERAAGQHPDAVVVVDSLGTLADQAGLPALLRAMPRLHAALRRFRLAAAAMTRWPYGEEVAPVLEAFDGLVTLRGVEEKVVFRQYFAVERARWSPRLQAQPRLFRAMKPGGVVVYIPKILVTGPFGAGKSTFVHAVSDTAVSAEALGTTVAMDHGHITIDGLTADLFGTPGQARFDPLIKFLSAQALGVVVVVDSTDPASFPRAKEMLEATWKQGLPATLVANKQDQPGALPPEEVARRVGVGGHVRVHGCVARDGAAAKRILKDLIDRILTQEVAA